MRVYETTFLINPQTDDSTIDKHVVSVSDIITGGGGKILHENRIGTRRLAYEIKKLTQGYYTSFVYEGTPKILSRLDHHFKFGEEYLRHLTILFEGNLEKLLRKDEDNKSDDFYSKPAISKEPAHRRPKIEKESEPAAETPADKPVEEKPTPAEEAENKNDTPETKPVTDEPTPVEKPDISEETAPVEESTPTEEPEQKEEPEKKTTSDSSLSDEYPEQEEEL
ncbi:MAG: 30S ribosomal protein S6 [candidate division Zixibacteria bacterium]|nr:30S ribosomal protein S6 [candidate division Zixibacteria bacterium]